LYNELGNEKEKKAMPAVFDGCGKDKQNAGRDFH